MQPRERLIFPLDVPNKTEAERLISLLKDHVGLFKVGLELFVAEGPAFLQLLTLTARVDYFLDLKFHDIPATVRGALSRVMEGARLATVHVDTGRESLKPSPEAQGSGVKLLGVTALTHLTPDDLEAMGLAREYANDFTKLVLLRAGIARAAGCDGVVCAGTEAAAVFSHPRHLDLDTAATQVYLPWLRVPVPIPPQLGFTGTHIRLALQKLIPLRLQRILDLLPGSGQCHLVQEAGCFLLHHAPSPALGSLLTPLLPSPCGFLLFLIV